jgi:lysine biosynthesis protein LysW
MAEQVSKLVKARCPHCEARLTYTRLPDLDMWDCCPECGASIKVISTDPLKFRWEERDYCDDEP